MATGIKGTWPAAVDAIVCPTPKLRPSVTQLVWLLMVRKVEEI